MSPPPEDAQLDVVLKEALPKLASLYDQFAHALDPFDPIRDRAESIFNQEVASLYDMIKPSIDLHTFKKEVIRRCRWFLFKGDRPSSI